MTDKRLIEVAFPLKQTSIDSAHEKNVRHAQEENRYRAAYPFHPDLVELFYAKWTHLKGREIEQAVFATSLHLQPMNQRANTRELKLLIRGGTLDRIELDKGLIRWADSSWYLDDTFIDDREDGLPKLWRLGSKPNLKQMHFDARSHISPTVLDEVLEKEIRGASKLTEEEHCADVKVHMLPTQPQEIDDDGEFHYAV